MANEDFTTYTEEDPLTKITITSSKVSWVSLDRNDVSYVYKDAGVNHFDGDFTHQFETMEITGTENGAFLYPYAVHNNVGDFNNTVVDGIGLGLAYLSSTPRIYFYLFENGSFNSDMSVTLLLDTLYYITVIRDDDGGANSTGQYTVYIRTGSHEGTLIDTLVEDCSAGEQNDLRYIYSIATSGVGSGVPAGDGYSQNLDLNESVPDAFVKIITVAYATVEKINTVSKSTIAKIFNVST